MFDRIETLRMASSMTSHGAQRQKLVARNVANADTPGYRARDLTDFTATYRRSEPMGMRATRPAHVAAGEWGGGQGRPFDTEGEPAPNGNTVSIEDEMVRMADAKREFDLSLAITKSSLGLIRTSLGRRA